ncbi:MAG: type II toxin-antitoxin system prevent-host-death family antitoxin [Candidatus Dormibacteraeota bacterium]|nr:type II toxin-antitoxin system prevent-host-death family antitoxin [Candidatus Dormibacteraeota bacterium]
MTAAQASRRFAAVLDEAESGETIVVTRGGRRVAIISPATSANGAALIETTRRWAASRALDPDFGRDVAEARSMAELDRDPWANV